MTTNYARADEVQVTLGKSKTTAGGEARAHFATKNECCVVTGESSGKSRHTQ